MNKPKEQFITKDIFHFLEKLDDTTKCRWGKMNARQMVEHLTDFYNVSAGNISFELVTPESHLPKYREFLLSEKPFRENTKAPVSVIGEDPLPERTKSMEEAINLLRQAVTDFEMHFSKDAQSRTMHPVFGMLDYDDWIQLHHKHVTHHLNQFGLLPTA